MQKILVLGGSGMVGSRFIELYKNVFKILSPDYTELNILDLDQMKNYLDQNKVDWVVNFSAYTDVNKAEAEKNDRTGQVWQLNVQGVENIFSTFHSRNVIQISTDMVFTGDISKPGPYTENEQAVQDPDKLTWYGYTKGQGEKVALSNKASVLRIIYPVRTNYSQKLDYIRSFLAKYHQGIHYPVFEDQQISISYIDEIAEGISGIINNNLYGIFHVSSDTTTPYELFYYLLKQLNLDTSKLQKGSVVEYLKTQANPYRYPVFGGLNSNSTENRLGLHLSTWQTTIDKLIAKGLS